MFLLSVLLVDIHSGFLYHEHFFFTSFFAFFGFVALGTSSAFLFELFLVVRPLLELSSLELSISMQIGLLVAFGCVFLGPELDSLSCSGSLTTSLFFSP